MITYSKTYWGLHHFFRVYGSAIPRSLLFAGFAAGLTAVIHVYADEDLQASWRHPFAYLSFSTIVGFIILFRSNFGYARYWEGRSQLAHVCARWIDAATMAVSFDRAAPPGESPPAGHAQFVSNVVHLISLLHALALQHLRSDWELDNLTKHRPDMPPVLDAAGRAPDVAPHFQLADLFVLRGSPTRMCNYNRSMPIGVIGGITAAEREGLAGSMERLKVAQGPQAAGESTDAKGGCVVHDDSCCIAIMQLSVGVYVAGASERVQVAFSWVLDLLNTRSKSGGLPMSPPILTRIYSVLVDGMSAFDQARKLVDTPFPFPWAQLVLLLLLLFTFSLPFLLVGEVADTTLAVAMSFTTVLAYWALNEVSRDLEDPFVYDPNELPLARMQDAPVAWMINTPLPYTPTYTHVPPPGRLVHCHRYLFPPPSTASTPCTAAAATPQLGS